MTQEYPTDRPPYFACGWLRDLLASRIGETIGPHGIALLTLVALAEDQNRYTRPAEYATGVMMAALGIGRTKLMATIKQCVELGLLAYEAGTSGKMGKMHVLCLVHAVNKTALSCSRREQDTPSSCSRGEQDEASPVHAANKTNDVLFTPRTRRGALLIRENLKTEEEEIHSGEAPAAETAVASVPAVAVNPWQQPRGGGAWDLLNGICDLAGLAGSKRKQRAAKLAHEIAKDSRYWGDDLRWRGKWITPNDIVYKLPQLLVKYGQGYTVKTDAGVTMVDIATIEKYWHWLREPPSLPVYKNQQPATMSQAAKQQMIATAITTHGAKPPY